MANRGNSLYNSGKKNPNAYPKNKKLLKEKITVAVVIIIALIGCLVSLLENEGIINRGELLNDTGAVDSVKTSDSEFTVYYLDAGQSDCSIIICNDQVMMIDAGTYDQVENIREALLSLNISTIDYMIITHQHDDHMGGAAAIIQNYDVKNIIMPRLSEVNMVTTYAYEELLTSISDRSVNAIAAEPGYHFNVGTADVDIFSPSEQDKNINNMSVVLKVVFGNTSFLFQGDAEKKIENALLKTDYDFTADVIKVGHHGSKTSSTAKYIQAVDPKAAIISCGADNSYGHPHSETLETLENADVDIYITSLIGDITAVSDGNKITITNEKTEDVKTYE
ncbi:MAG: MBL fold metallo-hydrolase [Oscillospiraceae bacterium]|nr:MBL fold metallo-hydrolase [Oscillospiraceae bacterium]